MNKAKVIFTVFLVFILFSCSTEEKSSGGQPEAVIEEYNLNTQTNLVVFFIPGLDQDIFSLLLDDPNSENLRNFKQLGTYEPISYFDDYSDISSNMTALMSGKTTLIGHLGIDKDSVVNKTWISDFEESEYQISIICDGSLGSKLIGAVFPGKTENIPFPEHAALNLIKHQPDFFWGMGTNLFSRRVDRKNLLEELGIKNYNISLDINKVKIKGSQKFAGIYNNFSIPDSVDLVMEGLKNWSRIRNTDSHVLILTYTGLEKLLETQSKNNLYRINSYIDYIVNIEGFNSESYLFLLINPFQNYDRVFEISKGDTIIYSSKALNYNQLNNNIWAYGVHSEIFGGNYQNTDLYRKITGIIKE
ncbi:hypothetical protein HZR84_02560 [Hyphobacterium sp. CCMP332]|nr:hypothetical protein HZR84_02560 [Hyphobacterium sp. CCMP332]